MEQNLKAFGIESIWYLHVVQNGSDYDNTECLIWYINRQVAHAYVSTACGQSVFVLAGCLGGRVRGLASHQSAWAAVAVACCRRQDACEVLLPRRSNQHNSNRSGTRLPNTTLLFGPPPPTSTASIIPRTTLQNTHNNRLPHRSTGSRCQPCRRPHCLRANNINKASTPCFLGRCIHN